MKKFIRIGTYMMIASLAAAFVSCEDDSSNSPSKLGFHSDAYTATEEDGQVTLGIALDHPTSTERTVTVSATGSATEGEDYVISEEITIPAGETNGVIVLDIEDDIEIEGDETIVISASSEGLSAGTYTVTVKDAGCEVDDVSMWATEFDALEDDLDGDPYGPYHLTLTQDTEDPNKFHMDNFYEQGLKPFIVFDVEAGTVEFPDGQIVGGKEITNSSGTYDKCEGTITINLTYDGYDWVYRLTIAH